MAPRAPGDEPLVTPEHREQPKITLCAVQTAVPTPGWFTDPSAPLALTETRVLGGSLNQHEPLQARATPRLLAISLFGPSEAHMTSRQRTAAREPLGLSLESVVVLGAFQRMHSFVGCAS